jgi:hypothetical protein
VAAAISGQADAPASIDTAVTWDGAAAGNAGMVADVQRWIDTPSVNHGWRITSSTEGGGPAMAQRFYAAEEPLHPPSLTLVYDCKAGFSASGSDCIPQAVDARGSDDASGFGGATGAGGASGVGGATGAGGASPADGGPTQPQPSGCSCSVRGLDASDAGKATMMMMLGAAVLVWSTRRRARRRPPT